VIYCVHKDNCRDEDFLYAECVDGITFFTMTGFIARIKAFCLGQEDYGRRKLAVVS
jgi:hypothetical protein